MTLNDRCKAFKKFLEVKKMNIDDYEKLVLERNSLDRKIELIDVEFDFWLLRENVKSEKEIVNDR